MALPNDYEQFLASLTSAKFQHLWPAQAHVLRTYARDFSSTPDIAIELPTGAGKTLIALLIGEAWRREGKKVAIISANKTLARQMQTEAEALGIPAVLMEGRGIDIPASDKRAYGRATRLAIMNYWVYINQNPFIDIADVLIMDDAHLAEHCLQSLYSLEIDSINQRGLFEELVAELHARFPEYAVLANDIDGAYPSPPELLSFIDQMTIADRLRDIIDASPDLRNDEGLSDLGFRWSRMRDHLNETNIYLGSRSIWMRPYVYPFLSMERYEGTTQRIYMSATIGDPADLSRVLGTRPIIKVPIPAADAEKTSGRRLIVINRIEDKDIPDRLQVVILTALRQHPKSVWLCASTSEAKHFQKTINVWLNNNGLVGHPTWLLTPLGDEIDQFKQSPVGHLFVAGRFDGMDFKGDECHLVVLTTLPRAINTQEEFLSTYVRDSGFLTRRLNQRIVQALGRCNRSDNDYGIYVFADRRFATHFGTEANKAHLPRNIVAEIDLAQNEAEIAEAELVQAVAAFSRCDFTAYDHAIQDCLKLVPITSAISHAPENDNSANDEVIGWSALFASQNYPLAAKRFERATTVTRTADHIELNAFLGWHWAKSLYLQGALMQDSAALAKALVTFSNTIQRGGRSAWFNHMRASLNRATTLQAQSPYQVEWEYADVLLRAFDDLLERYEGNGTRFERWCGEITSRLETQNHTQYQEGLEKLGQILAYQAARPRYPGATDCRWIGNFGNHREIFTFEAKIEHDPANQITLHDVGQAHNQQTRTTGEFHGHVVRSVIVTHMTTVASDALASLGTICLVEKDAVLALWHRVRTLLSVYRDQWSLTNIAARKAAAYPILQAMPRTSWLIRTLDGTETGTFIDASHLCAEWGEIS